MKRIVIRLLLPLIVVLLGSSCASSKRMMRISPFGTSDTSMPDSNRVNAWPLAYHHQACTSVLWPIIDIDPDGFAVRPLLNIEDTDWSVLFPLSSYNVARKVGWLGTAYRYEDYHGIFPLYHWGKDFKSMGPFWRAEKSHGVFPLYLRSEDKAKHDTFLALLGHHGVDRGQHSTLLWPLVSWTEESYMPGPFYRLTLLGYQRSDTRFSMHLTPLAGYAKTEDTRKSYVWPVYSAYTSPTYSRYGFLFSHNRTNYKDGEVIRRSAGLPLGLARYKKNVKDETSSWSVLYGAVSYKQDRERTRTSVLRYLYSRNRKGDEITRDIFPFIKWDSAPDHGRFSLLWRVLNVEKKNGKLSGHLLFVPFGSPA